MLKDGFEKMMLSCGESGLESCCSLFESICLFIWKIDL